MPNLEIYKASAGSGKTWQLAVNYLSLLLANPDNYQRILAVTFTNKATAEMKARILHVLKGLANNPGSNDAKPYRDELLRRFPNLAETELSKQAGMLYSTILHNYGRFSVTTIDSFVQRIIRSFAWEINIDSGFQLQLDTTPVKEDLVLRLYKRLETDDDLRTWVVDLAKARLEEGLGWNMKDEVLRMADELFKERFADFEAALRTLEAAGDINEAFRQLSKRVNAEVATFEKEWKALGKQALNLIESCGATPADFHYGAKGFINYAYKISRGQVEEPNTRVTEILADANRMAATKASVAAKANIAIIQDALHRLYQQFDEWYQNRVPQYYTAKAIRKNLGVLRLMRVFAEELKNYRAENNRLLMSDTHLLLRELTKETDTSFIFEKIGTQYNHYLIDEYQDTSAFQWDNFKALVQNSLAESNYNMLVGDVKQAIYRWRNGDWRLLLNKVEQQIGPGEVRVQNLQDNRRSTREVIEFNNYLFTAAPALLQNEMNAEMAQAPANVLKRLTQEGYTQIYNKAYADAVQAVPDTAATGGVVRIEMVPDKDDQGEALQYTEVVMAALHHRIGLLLQEGYRAADFAILTRTNGEAAQIVNDLIMLQQQTGSHSYDLLSGEALMLHANHAVQLLLCALRVLSDSRDTLSLANLRHLYRVYTSSPAPDYEVFATSADMTGLPALFAQGNMELRGQALAEIVHQLIIIFHLHRGEADAPYLLAFQDVVSQWSKYGETGLEAFLQYWDTEGVKKALPGGANTNAVEVITIHKAKGLAFTVVLMPYLDWELTPAGFKAPNIWVNTSGTPYNNIPLVPVRYNATLAHSAFAYEYFEEQMFSVMDNLNVLYVAFTRARHRIYAWAPGKANENESKKGSGINKIHKLLLSAAGNKGLDDTNEVTDGFDKDAMVWQYGQPLSPGANNSKPVAEVMPALHYHRWQPAVKVRYRAMPADPEATQQLPRNAGTLLHEALARLQTPADVELVVHQMQVQGLVSSSQYQQLRKTLGQVLQLPLLDAWRQGRMQRMSERSLLATDGSLKRPDMVLYNTESTLVIDFKFTQSQDQEASYHAQVLEYVHLLAACGFAGVSGAVVYGFETRVLNV
jgi:ATP-dependent exoDNAse (exonuclease V) beta subunit